MPHGEYFKNVLSLRTPDLLVMREKLRREIEAEHKDGKSPKVQLFRRIEAEIRHRKAHMQKSHNSS